MRKCIDCDSEITSKISLKQLRDRCFECYQEYDIERLMRFIEISFFCILLFVVVCIVIEKLKLM